MVAQLFKALRYKLEGGGFESRWGQRCFLNLSGSIMAVAYQGYLLGVKAVGAYSWRYHFRTLIVLKAGSQPPEAEGIALP